MTTPAPAKIVIVAGQEFSVPAETDNEAIRAQLSGMGFADVAAATIQAGKRTIEGVEHPTVEFVKKAGTKGLDGAELAALIDRVPPARVSRRGRLRRAERALLDRLVDHELTIAQALADGGQMIDAALRGCTEYTTTTSEGERVCEPCDQLRAVAASVPFAW